MGAIVGRPGLVHGRSRLFEQMRGGGVKSEST